MSLSIIIVNYRTRIPLEHCLTSLALQSYQDFDVVIVDNENDPLLRDLVTNRKLKVALIQNTENKGFGRANNQGVLKSQGERILLLNPDTLLRDPLTLETLLAYQEDHPHYGVIGVPIRDHQAGWIGPHRTYPGIKKIKVPAFEKLPGEIAWILGACMLFKRPVYEAIGGFNEDFFLYGEEADLCLRLRKKGWPIGWCDRVTIEHLGGVSERTIPEYEYWTKKQKGLYLFYTKNYPEALWRKLLRKEKRRTLFRLFTLWIEIHVFRKAHYAIKVQRNRAIYDCIQSTIIQNKINN